MKKLKISLVVIIVLLVILIVATIVLNQTGVIKRIANNINKEEIKKEISYEVYEHVNGKTTILVIVEDTENGIDKITYPDNEMELSCNGKTKVAFDYHTDITGKESLTFKAINTIGEEIEKTILINDQFYLDLIDYNLVDETETQKALTVNYKAGSTTKQYKIGDSSAWVNYGGVTRLDYYQIIETLGQGNKEPNIYIRQIDNMGYEIVTKVKYNIDEGVTYKQQDTIIEGDSILACVENNDLTSGNYIFRVTYTEAGNTIDYPVELYNYDEDAHYITNNRAVIAGRTYTGMGKISQEKRMLVLKYNGDLTINSGVTITPTGTNASINGATYLCTKKGMLIYCAGTLTNNGTITMTAKGTVNQAGENVYLYKNEGGTYEYVPAVGASGGAAASGKQAGKNGGNGTARRTGGGASGGAYNGTSGAGGNGTSYSGGSGGGGKGSLYKYTSATGGSSTGGAGGNAANMTVGNKYACNAGGGAGNPGGKPSKDGGAGSIGTGGLLTIIASSLENNGAITSDGSTGGYGGTGNFGGGGGSGAGSINLFYKENFKRGTITVTGGVKGTGKVSRDVPYSNGGTGGTGTITTGNISTGTFVKD